MKRTILPILGAALLALAACRTGGEANAEQLARELPEIRYFMIADT